MDDKLAGFEDSGFDATKYINEICARCVGGSELNSQKAKLFTLGDQTNTALKRTVFQHYGQFIETAKDISYLASEMCQISQMLRDQKAVIQSILDTSIIAPRKTQNTNGAVSPTEFVVKLKTNEDEERKKLVLSVLEKVEGASQIMEDEKRTLIFEGDLLEIDPDNYSAVQRKRGYLFSDGIMLAVWVTNRRGPQRYRFEAFYELGEVGMVVNIRDPECPKHTFKLLIFPSVYLLQCPNQQDKDAWVNHIEGRQKIIRNNPPPGKIGLDSPTQEALPGFPSIESERTKSPEGSSAMLSFQPPLPEWVVGIPEDLDVWIAQRNFIEAVDLYEAFQEFLETEPLLANLKEIKVKVDTRIKQLIKILVGDLEVMTPEKILQGGPRSIRKSIDLLIRLNRENQASKLFLTHRSAYIKQRMKRLKSDGRNQEYLANLSEVFFTSILESMKEYKKSFSVTTAGTAGLVVWMNSELTTFMTSFCRQLFTPQCHLSHVSTAVSAFRTASRKLVDMGLDISTSVDYTLLPYVERTITDAKDKLVEAIRHRYRSQEECDLLMTFSDETSLNKTLMEMKQLGVVNMEGYIRDTSSLEVSSNTLAFSKSWLHFCQDLMELSAPEWQSNIQTAICEVLLFELPHLEHSLNRAKRKKDLKLIQMIEKDATFVLEHVAPAANRIYEKGTGERCVQLYRIVEDSSLSSRKGASSPSKVTKTKYTSPEFV